MTRIASPIEHLKDHYTVVVVGSGYGGGIAASRLARAGQQVCVLERGREFVPGEFPDTQFEGAREMQIDAPPGHVGSRTGLYDLRVNEHINVFIGCGLGGTSLINANVSLEAERRVFDDPRWPKALRDDVDTALQDGVRRAYDMLKPNPYPADFPALPKLQAHERSAAHMKEKFYRVPLNVHFEADGVNHVGVHQQTCKLCGDCVSGCNHAAKNTTAMNYLPDAKNHGAEIYTETAVRYIERRDDRWHVHFQVLGSGREAFNKDTLFVSADVVVVAAGTLGSTEILLRSRDKGLPLSDKLGHDFGGNGDILGFGYNTDHKINGIGFGHRPVDPDDPVGPCITGVIDLRERDNLTDGMIIEEGVCPGAVSTLLYGGLGVTAAMLGEETAPGGRHYVSEKVRQLETLIRGSGHGALNNTQTFLIMSHDDAGGRMYLKDDRLRIAWPGVGEQREFHEGNKRLAEATEALGGTFVPNPTWTKLADHNVVTVHPLGGCCMAESADRGVVNHKGQVFSAAEGTDVHEGLYVCDGAVLPRAVGVNPLLTISAIAERNCALLAQDHGWTIDYTLPSTPKEPVAERTLGVRFTETMKGFFSTNEPHDFAAGAKRGKAEASPFAFTLTVVGADIDRMLNEESHDAEMFGTVVAPALSAEPLTVHEGRFNLFVHDPDHVNTRQMRYRMRLVSEEGRHYYFYGYKQIHRDSGFDIWADTTTLFITVHDGPDQESPVLGKGVLKIHPTDFAKQLTTMEALNAKNSVERMQALARFGTFFAGSLYDVFGGIFVRTNEFNPEAQPRKKRPLRMDPPQVHFFSTTDDVQLRLTRYQGGNKGPVILAPGFGTSTLAFSIDTVGTNLPEYLYAHDYDVWLFDYRASPDLPSAATQFTLDDIALQDYPAAVATVRELTGADDVQAVAHCVGSLTLLMALASGLQGVRSVVSSQLTLHPVAPTLNQIKAGLHLGSFLHAIGVDTLSTDYDSTNWKDRLYDKVLRLYPTKEPFVSPVDRRILFMYGEVYKIAQLNEATHRAMHEMFGVANLATFEHISTMLRKGHIVDKGGNETYLPHVDRMTLPIAFLHGAENGLFLPEGSKQTYELLCKTNGDRYYSRHVIPNYAHMDCFIGRDAARDVYPTVLEELEKYN